MNSNLALNYDNYPDGQEIVVMSKKQIPPETEWIETDVAAQIMETTRANVTYLCREKKIRCEKFSGVWKVSKQDAEDYIKSARAGRKQE